MEKLYADTQTLVKIVWSCNSSIAEFSAFYVSGPPGRRRRGALTPTRIINGTDLDWLE